MDFLHSIEVGCRKGTLKQTDDVNWERIVNLSGNLSFQTKDLEKMVIEPAGDVGIGTTNPTAKLEVSRRMMVGIKSICGSTIRAFGKTMESRKGSYGNGNMLVVLLVRSPGDN